VPGPRANAPTAGHCAAPLVRKLGIKPGARLGLSADLVDSKVCAIDQVWSGLRLVYRVRDRPGKALA
jgi:hypothetical protein